MRYFLSHIKLKTDRCIRKVFESGEVIFKSNCVVIYMLKVSESEGFKFAVVVLKEYGNSVERNRIKRLTKEYFRLNQHRIKDFHIVIKYKKNPGFINYFDAEKFFEKIFSKNNIFKDC